VHENVTQRIACRVSLIYLPVRYRLCARVYVRVREAIERLHEHMRKDMKTNDRCQSTRLTRPPREKVTSFAALLTDVQ